MKTPLECFMSSMFDCHESRKDTRIHIVCDNARSKGSDEISLNYSSSRSSFNKKSPQTILKQVPPVCRWASGSPLVTDSAMMSPPISSSESRCFPMVAIDESSPTPSSNVVPFVPSLFKGEEQTPAASPNAQQVHDKFTNRMRDPRRRENMSQEKTEEIRSFSTNRMSFNAYQSLASAKKKGVIYSNSDLWSI
jgi:hypothetical protein